MTSNLRIINATSFVRALEQLGSGEHKKILPKILHENYHAGHASKSIENTWNTIWEDLIDPKIKYERGIDALFDRLAIYNEYLQEVKFDILCTFQNEDQVFIHALMSFDQVDDIMGYPPPKERVEIESFWNFTFIGDLIVSLAFNVDFYKWLTSIGASLFKEGDEFKIKKYLDNLRAQNILPSE